MLINLLFMELQFDVSHLIRVVNMIYVPYLVKISIKEQYALTIKLDLTRVVEVTFF